MTLSLILTQFIFRLSFGLAIAMGVTPSKFVTSGFYRVHLWVLMGFNTLAALAVNYADESFPNRQFVFVVAVVVAGTSFVGSAIWLYEKHKAGQIALFVVALASLVAAAQSTMIPPETTGRGIALLMADLTSGGFLLGVTLSAMFLGHWYLNTPTMDLIPLRRLVLMMVGAIIARSVLCAIGLVIHLGTHDELATNVMVFIALRWLSGLIGTAALAWMTWQTLKVPNTQSATGILYAGVILAFIGELVSNLLSVGQLYPL